MQCLFSTLHPMRQLLYLQCCLLIVFWTKAWIACQKITLLWTNKSDQDGRVWCLFSVPHSMHMHHHHQFCFLSNLLSQRNKWLEERNSRVRTMSQRVWLIFNALLNWAAAKSSMRFCVLNKLNNQRCGRNKRKLWFKTSQFEFQKRCVCFKCTCQHCNFWTPNVWICVKHIVWLMKTKHNKRKTRREWQTGKIKFSKCFVEL